MKILFALLLLAYPVLASADETLTITTYYPSPYGSYNQLYVASNTYLAYNTGNVGIGTTGPATKLHIAGDSPVLRLADTGTTNWQKIESRDSSGNYGRLFIDGNYVNLNYNTNANVTLAYGGGNVGIGTVSPSAMLQIAKNNGGNGSAGSSDYGMVTTATGGQATLGAEYIGDGFANLNLGQSNGPTRRFWHISSRVSSTSSPYSLEIYNYTSGSGFAGPLFTFTTTGRLGIGLANPSYQLQLSTDSAAKPGTNTWTIASDKRLKKDIRPYTNGLEIIKKIKPVWFKYNGKAGFPQDNQEHIGVIGQEIIKVAPYTVNTFKAKLNPADKKETELLNFNSHALVFDLINAVKEQQAQIEALKKEIANLKSPR